MSCALPDSMYFFKKVTGASPVSLIFLMPLDCSNTRAAVGRPMAAGT